MLVDSPRIPRKAHRRRGMLFGCTAVVTILLVAGSPGEAANVERES